MTSNSGFLDDDDDDDDDDRKVRPFPQRLKTP